MYQEKPQVFLFAPVRALILKTFSSNIAQERVNFKYEEIQTFEYSQISPLWEE